MAKIPSIQKIENGVGSHALTTLFSSMNGIKKAALFLSSLDYAAADQLLSRLDATSAKLVRREIMSLRSREISVEESHRLDEEFLQSAGWKSAHTLNEHQFVPPTSAASPQPTTYTLPKHSPVKHTAEAFVRPVRPFDFMRNWPVSDILAAIIDEHPQAIAIVLAHLPQSKMKSVLSASPIELQQEMTRRLEEYEMPDEQIVQEIESALKVRYRNHRHSAKHSAVLQSFDDVGLLSDSDLSTLFHSVDLTTSMLALIGAEPALIARITKHFSPMEESEMRKRLKMLNTIDTEEIDQARRDILEQYNMTGGTRL